MATLAFQNPAAATEPQQLPRNIEAEAALLGAMMIDNRLADDLVDRLEPAHFYEPVHGRIFASIKTLRAADMLPDEQAGRLVVELFADVLGELGAHFTTARAQPLRLGQRVFETAAWQIRRQRLAFTTALSRRDGFFINVFGNRFSDAFGFVEQY